MSYFFSLPLAQLQDIAFKVV